MEYTSLKALKILDCAFKGVNSILIELLDVETVEEKGRTDKHGYPQDQWGQKADEPSYIRIEKKNG